MSEPLLNDLDIDIDGVDDEGRGRGTVGDWDVAVRGAWPGDRVRARVERRFPARNVAQARALQVLEAGPLHTQRSCSHPGPCAGCPLEGVDDGFARALLRQRVIIALEDAGLAQHVDRVADLVVDDVPLRQKVKLAVGGESGALRLGLFVPHSHELVGAERCPHHHPQIRRAIDAMVHALNLCRIPPAPASPQGLTAVIIRATRQGPGAVIVVGRLPSERSLEVLQHLVRPGVLASLAVRVDAGGGNSVLGGSIAAQFGPATLPPLDGGPDVAVDAFCQAIPTLASDIYARAAAFLTVDGSDGVFVDAYAGTGGFSRALLARGVQNIVAIESAAPSLAGLRALPVDARAGFVQDELPRIATPVQGIVLDPPKKGLVDDVAAVVRLGAPRLVLVSCDPDAMAKDIAALGVAYDVVDIVPYALFPASTEVEAFVTLVRRK